MISAKSAHLLCLPSFRNCTKRKLLSSVLTLGPDIGRSRPRSQSWWPAIGFQNFGEGLNADHIGLARRGSCNKVINLPRVIRSSQIVQTNLHPTSLRPFAARVEVNMVNVFAVPGTHAYAFLLQSALIDCAFSLLHLLPRMP